MHRCGCGLGSCDWMAYAYCTIVRTVAVTGYILKLVALACIVCVSISVLRETVVVSVLPWFSRLMVCRAGAGVSTPHAALS